ncbi:MAG: beta-N-acetylhexosaminidase [Candidatus Glassbacteria bacterium]|nr:beta-N-acetylhexosaminidase [Candidatus Glassbacteria bacterium]
MVKALKFCLTAALFFAAASSIAAADFTTGLRSLGYSLIPAPRQVELAGREVRLGPGWSLECELGPGHIACRSLVLGLRELHGLEPAGTGGPAIVLRVAPGTVKGTPDPLLNSQGYRLSIGPGRIEVVGEAEPGLFYGVQSLLQLIRKDGSGGWLLPEGVIRDWPALQLRFMHWDTKHHQSRPETLKRYLDQAALFKINAVGFEIEDRYEYPRHPVIGIPGAYTRAEMQELTAYALERFIQLVPQVQAPAHMAYVLKHPEFAGFRADGSNYQACMCDEEAIRLIQDMYQDMIDATPGVEYFHCSTDEVYYAGICKKCRKPYDAENRSRLWVDYVNRMHAWLAERGRRMLCWVEYPLLTEHIKLLPAGLIDAITVSGRSDEWIRSEKEAGIFSLIYSSQQGAELLFPNYFPTVYHGRRSEGYLAMPARSVSGLLARKANALGTYCAAWDDAGLHDETFWLGWATVAQYGWSPETPAVEQSVADFMDVFYGPGNRDMVEIYRGLMEGARFFESSWDQVPSTDTKPAYGNPWAKDRGTTRIDLTLEPPALPFAWDCVMVVEPTFSRRYGKVLEEALRMDAEIEKVIYALQGKLDRAVRNRYNLEVLLSIAYFEKHFTEMLLALQQTEQVLLAAEEAGREDYPERAARMGAVNYLARAHGMVEGILQERAGMWKRVKTVWEKGRYPKNRSVGGKDYLHVLDDLKDHFADRKPGLEYMIAPLERIGLEDWNRRLAGFIRSYAASHQVPVPDLGG